METWALGAADAKELAVDARQGRANSSPPSRPGRRRSPRRIRGIIVCRKPKSKWRPPATSLRRPRAAFTATTAAEPLRQFRCLHQGRSPNDDIASASRALGAWRCGGLVYLFGAWVARPRRCRRCFREEPVFRFTAEECDEADGAIRRLSRPRHPLRGRGPNAKLGDPTRTTSTICRSGRADSAAERLAVVGRRLPKAVVGHCIGDG